MQPARFRQKDILLVEINNAKSTNLAVSSGEERGLPSRTAAGNRAQQNSGAVACRFESCIRVKLFCHLHLDFY